MRPKGVATYLAGVVAVAAAGEKPAESILGRLQRALTWAQNAHTALGVDGFEEEVGATEYADFVTSFNDARAAALAIDPTAVVPPPL
jgi:hypothetical protein